MANEFPDNSGLHEVTPMFEGTDPRLQLDFVATTEGYGNAWTVRKTLDGVLLNHIRRQVEAVVAEVMWSGY